MVDPGVFHSILCAVGGPSSEEAVRQAAALAGPRTELSLVAVGSGDRAEDAWLREAEAVAAGLGVTTIAPLAHAGNPQGALLEASADVDLLVVGGAGDVVLGGIASAAVHAGTRSVLMARRPPEGRDFPHDILIATDGSPDSQRGADLGGAIGRAHDARVAFVHVDDGHGGSGPELGPGAVMIEEFGDPADRIADVARRERVSLVVVGSRGVGGARGLGSVGERLAHQAPCSVLVSRSGG